ncbi:MAG: flagellar filament capping protein FliD [Pseudomonadales bacterium]|nr:flagellar filament capping protein FliD [Pseudomonadales bacterium]
MITALGIGSGLDINGLLAQLESAERLKLNPITEQKQSTQARISAFGSLKSALSQLQIVSNKLNESTLFDSVKSSVSGTGVTAAAHPGAPVGSFQIEVTQLARAFSVASTGLADRTTNLGAATLSLELGSGELISVDIAAESSSLENVRDAINATGAGVQAALVNDGSANPHRLVLTSTQTGTQAAISTIDFGALAGSLALDATTEVTARDATLNINGIAISSQSNQVEEAIQGITLNLTETGSTSLTVARDDKAVKDAIKSFVSTFNNLRSNIDSLNSFNADTGVSGRLLGNSTLRSVQSQLRTVLSEGAGTGGGEFQQLSDIGITLQLDGKLELDEARLDDVISNDFADLTSFFAGPSVNEGLAGRIHQSMEQMLSEQGLINTATEGLTSSIERLDQRQLRVEQGIDTTLDRFRTQFARLDSLIAGLNATSNVLVQQFDALDGLRRTN